MLDKKTAEQHIFSISSKARAAGIVLVMGTARTDLLNAALLNCFPSRIAFMLPTAKDYKTVLGQAAKEYPCSPGDMLFKEYGSSSTQNISGCYVDVGNIPGVSRLIKAENLAHYDDFVLQKICESELGIEPEPEDSLSDPVFIEAVEIALEVGSLSTSYLQRRLRLGYARAGKIMDQMDSMGIIDRTDGSKPRQVLITRQQWLDILAQ